MRKLMFILLGVLFFSLVSCVNDNGNASIDSKVNQGEESMKQSDEYQHIYVDSFTVITSYNQLVDLNKDGWEISGYDENYFTENNLVVFHFTKNSQEEVLGIVNSNYDMENEILYIKIDVQSPGHFSIHTSDIQQTNLLINLSKSSNIDKLGLLVYNKSLDEYHSVYYNCSMKTWDDYLGLPNS
jgi:hypothetical protein